MVGGLVFTFDFRAAELPAGRERRPAATRRSSAAAPLQQRRRDIAGGGVRRRARVRELRERCTRMHASTGASALSETCRAIGPWERMCFHNCLFMS